MDRNARRRAANLKRAQPAFFGAVASGNDLAAQNDEPEPGHQPGDLTEADLAEIDAQFNIGKAERWHRQNDRRARELDQQMRDVGLLR